MSNKVYMVVIAVLLGVVGWMAYSMNNKDKINKKAMRKLMNEAKTREAAFQTDLTIEPVYTVLETEEPFDVNSPERNEL